jgi:hypothetical protein
MYKTEISMFIEALKKIGEEGKFSVDDLRARFGNELMESILWNVGDPVITINESDDVSRGVINRIKKLFKSCFS